MSVPSNRIYNPVSDVGQLTLGARAGSGVSSRDVHAIPHKLILSFTDTPMPLTDVAGVVAYSGLKIYDMPAGVILILGAIANLTLTKSSAGVNADWDGDFSLGSVTASNNATLTSTEADIIPSTATPQAVSGATTAKGANTGVAVLDGHTTPVDIFLNLLVDDADQDVTTTPCNLIVNGTIELIWVQLGDF